MTSNFDFNLIAQKALKNIRSLARGNGAQSDAIQIKEANHEMVQCEAITHLELHPDIQKEQKPGRVNAQEVYPNAQALEKAVNDYTTQSIKNSDVRKMMAGMLLERKDKGFSLHSEFFDIPPLSKTFCVHENCGTCGGQGQSTCKQCGGRRQEPCYTCHGKGIVPCTYCRATGTLQDSNGNKRSCHHCGGTSQIICKICQRKGQVPCRQCKAQGIIKCFNCKGLGAFSILNHVALKMKTVFEIDRAALPHPAVKAIERTGSQIVERGHIQIEGEQVKREDGGLAIQYKVQFPYGNLLCAINGQPIKVELFGYKGKIIKLPAFLENMIGTNVSLLERAARKENTESNIIKASKTRIISEALSLTLNFPRKIALMKLKKRYPLGISNEGLKSLISTSHLALQQVTSKSRYMGYAITVAIAFLIDAGYFLFGVRDQLLGMLGPQITPVIDFSLILIGGVIGNIVIQKIIQRPLQKALGHLNKNPKPKNLAKWPSFALSAGAFILTLAILLALGQAPSYLNF